MIVSRCNLSTCNHLDGTLLSLGSSPIDHSQGRDPTGANTNVFRPTFESFVKPRQLDVLCPLLPSDIVIVLLTAQCQVSNGTPDAKDVDNYSTVMINVSFKSCVFVPIEFDSHDPNRPK